MDFSALVRTLYDQAPPAKTVEGAFRFTARVAWALRTEGAGLLLKPGGENIWTFNGRSYSASRICFPNGQLYKVLTDVPTTNGPSWQENGFVSTDLYSPAIDIESTPEEPSKPPTPDPLVLPVDYGTFVTKESWEVAEAYRNTTGNDPAVSDMYHNAWRRLVEGWTHENILRAIRGEPLQ